MTSSKTRLPCGYEALRPLSKSENALLCREEASGRLLVVKLRQSAARLRDEARALAAAAGFVAAPALYFAMVVNGSTPGASWLGLEYRTGRPLRELAGRLEKGELGRLAAKLQFTVRSLHEDWRMAHGGLTPDSILLSDDGALSFLNWDKAIARRGPGSGTTPVTLDDDAISLPQAFEKDWQAIETCLNFLRDDGAGTPLPGASKNPKLSWDWMQRT